MEFTADDSDEEKYVCAECIGDEIVHAAILALHSPRECSYCGTKRSAVAIEQIAEEVDPIWEQMVGFAEETPEFATDSDKVEYHRRGDTPETILSEMLVPDDDQISADIIGILAGRHSYIAIKDGGEELFDSSSDTYVWRVPRDPEVKETWANFCYSIKHRGRYFNEEAAEWLHEILAPLVSADVESRRSAVRTINPGDADSFVFRGRMGNSLEDRHRILRNRVSELGTAPKLLNLSGRMNAAGIPVFYGSFDIKTCVAELRGPVLGTAVVGKFAITRPLRVLDLTKLDEAGYNISAFDAEVVRKVAYNRFLAGFHDEIKKAVIPGTEPLDYLPTQFVAEYLWTRPTPPLDGVIYGSAQISRAEARNIALFPHASGIAAEAPEPKKAPDSGEGAGGAVIEGDFREFVLEKWRPEMLDIPCAPALMLVEDGITIARISGIEYTLDEQSLRLYEVFGEHDPDRDGEDD